MHVASNHEFASASRTGNPIKTMKHGGIVRDGRGPRVHVFFIMNADFLLWSGIILILADRRRQLISFDGDLNFYVLVIVLFSKLI